MDAQTADLLKVIVGAAAAVATGFFGGMQKKSSKDVQQLRAAVIPLDDIARDVGILKTRVEVIQRDILDIKDDQKETKADVKKAINDRAEILSKLATLEGVERERARTFRRSDR